MNVKDEHIVITGMGSISPLGCNTDEVWQSYRQGASFLQPKKFNGDCFPVASVSDRSEDVLKCLRREHSRYQPLDRTVIMAIHASRLAVQQAEWKRADKVSRTGINIGSSRGATSVLEKYHAAYVENPSQRISPLASPTSTLGNIASWVANDLQSDGPEISHSITCSTALHAIFNGIAWLRAGFADTFLAGAAEAPLTGFTLAQMKALRIYTNDIDTPFPSRPCSSQTPLHDTLALGEGATVFALEKMTTSELMHKKKTVLGIIESFGYAQEKTPTPTAISEEGFALQRSMTMALKNMPVKHPVDLIILHAPGTILGDKSELGAIKAVFGSETPILVSNKWLIGHTLGAASALSLEYALLILKKNHYVDFPYPVMFTNRQRPIRTIMINSAGFGGNAATLVVSNVNE
ncbi:MAG: beta-ketoacyl synthase [Ignavibacteria bacterium]|nr:beta-ketoacyl synthase [Ignavibacteria bacterium]